jgi:hypothetical protein
VADLFQSLCLDLERKRTHMQYKIIQEVKCIETNNYMTKMSMQIYKNNILTILDPFNDLILYEFVLYNWLVTIFRSYTILEFSYFKKLRKLEMQKEEKCSI